MGSEDDYTVIWGGTDFLRMRIQPYMDTIKLKGQPITAYVEVNFRVPARPNEGTCFILCLNENDESDYGQWKVLENTYSPLMQSPGVYSLAAEHSQLRHLERQGNAMGQFQYTIRDNCMEELETTLNKAFQYHQQSMQKQKQSDEEADSFLSDDDDSGFGY
jgi:hypothetical protein